jgi:hypothetical protein
MKAHAVDYYFYGDRAGMSRSVNFAPSVAVRPVTIQEIVSAYTDAGYDVVIEGPVRDGDRCKGDVGVLCRLRGTVYCATVAVAVSPDRSGTGGLCLDCYNNILS